MRTGKHASDPRLLQDRLQDLKDRKPLLFHNIVPTLYCATYWSRGLRHLRLGLGVGLCCRWRRRRHRHVYGTSSGYTPDANKLRSTFAVAVCTRLGK